MIKDSNIITIKGLNKEVPGKKLLDDINLTIAKGERIAIVGGNGAGKTTLVETMLGIQTKSSGTVEYSFEFVKSPLEKVGVQFQDSNFPQGLSAKEILNFFIEKSVNTDRSIADDLVKKFKMESFMDTDSSKLSGGQAQKLNVVLSLINKPEILVLDELTTGLDVFAKNEITNVVEEYLKKSKASMLLVTHTPHEIERLATRVIVLEAGKIIDDIAVSKLVKKHGSVGKFLDQI